MDKCFCHLTIDGESYQVKDSEARESIEELQTKTDSLQTTINSIPYFMNNKRILVIGDSISNEEGLEGINWVKWVRNNFSNTTVDNISYNGALLTGEGGQAKRYNDNVTETYDYIIVALGVNDAYHQAGLTTLSYTNNDINSFNGALTYLNDAIISKNPTAQVFYVSPLRNNYEQSNMVFCDVYRTYIYKACNLFGWTFIDAGHNVPILNPYNSTIKDMYISDGIHPNESYAPILGQYIVNKMVSGGDNSIGSYNSRMDLTSLIKEEYREYATLHAEFNSSGTVKLTFTSTNISMGSGIGMVVTDSLPYWCRPYSPKIVNVQYELSSFLGKVTGSQIQLFPNVTATGGISLECEFSITNMSEILETQI